ncbi:MAG: GIY-YIG nuclease family protein [Beijerinckiaceae bacterium]|nr:GIY-YIG nuclease family protein [Beijerinckiaceae bacterium]
MKGPAFVYLARRNSDWAVKVGYAADPCLRIRLLGQQTPCELRKVYYAESRERAREIEAAAHLALEDCALGGEWFSAPLDSVVRVVGAIVSGRRPYREYAGRLLHVRRVAAARGHARFAADLLQ